MALPQVVVQIPIPGSLWKRWKALEQAGGQDIQDLVPDLLRQHLDREEERRGWVNGFDYQI